MKIIYLNHGYLCVVNPSFEALEQMTIEELAQQIIPENTSFRIVEDNFFPLNDEYRDAWTIAEDLTGNIFIDQTKVEAIKLSKLKPLSRRQFRRVLVQNGYDLDVIKAKILEIEDTQTRQLTLIDWEDADTFERLDTSLIMMAEMMGMSDDQVNAMWEQALTI